VSDNVDLGTDHLSTDPSIAPRPGQPFTALAEQLAAQAAADGPEPVISPAALPLVAETDWRFRTYPGRASATIALRIPVESDDIDDNVKRKNKYKRWLDRQVTQGKIDRSEIGKDGLLKADKAVFDLTGEYHIHFRPVRVGGKRAMEAQYTTDQKVIADYIRSRLMRGEFAGEIYEDVRPMTVEVGGQRIQVMPADETARKAMAAAAAR
jgi:hypothetical protein